MGLFDKINGYDITNCKTVIICRLRDTYQVYLSAEMVKKSVCSHFNACNGKKTINTFEKDMLEILLNFNLTVGKINQCKSKI